MSNHNAIYIIYIMHRTSRGVHVDTTSLGMMLRDAAQQPVVLSACLSLQVQIQKVAFMKDVAFYLTSLLLMTALIADGKVGYESGGRQQKDQQCKAASVVVHCKCLAGTCAKQPVCMQLVQTANCWRCLNTNVSMAYLAHHCVLSRCTSGRLPHWVPYMWRMCLLHSGSVGMMILYVLMWRIMKCPWRRV